MRKGPPKGIRTEKENEAYTQILYELDRRSKLTAAEKELAELLTLLTEDFEEKRYRIPKSKPLDVLRFLMDQHNLLQKDLADVFGTPGIVSEVLNSKRDLNKEQIARLRETGRAVTGHPADSARLKLFFINLRFSLDKMFTLCYSSFCQIRQARPSMPLSPALSVRCPVLRDSLRTPFLRVIFFPRLC